MKNIHNLAIKNNIHIFQLMSTKYTLPRSENANTNIRN